MCGGVEGGLRDDERSACLEKVLIATGFHRSPAWPVDIFAVGSGRCSHVRCPRTLITVAANGDAQGLLG